MTTASVSQSSAATRPSLYKTLFATCIGNALEWFDIAVYGFFASTLLISATGSSLAPSYYLMITALLSVLALWQAQLRQR
ncbi:hypothetical protein HGI48_05435 [Dickeya dianthicola]|nr:hypothetical protein HGI48_05435 [Dickeya dianthicola]